MVLIPRSPYIFPAGCWVLIRPFISKHFSPIIQIIGYQLPFYVSVEEIMMRKFFSFLMGTVMGALVGATVALLLTPESGEEFRGLIRQRFESLQGEIQEAAATRRIELEKQLADLRQPKTVSVPLEDSKQ
jgi:hypothetical protein